MIKKVDATSIDASQKDQIPQKYCTPAIFARFVCALLRFLLGSFLQNTEPNNLGKLLCNVPCITKR